MTEIESMEAAGFAMLVGAEQALDPLTDAEEAVVKNRAKVGSARPSSLLYTYGPAR